MLHVACSPEVPPAIQDQLEHHARATGLSLGALEAVAQSLDRAEQFIVAAEDGHAQQWLEAEGLAPPQEQVARARWIAARLFGQDESSPAC